MFNRIWEVEKNVQKNISFFIIDNSLSILILNRKSRFPVLDRESIWLFLMRVLLFKFADNLHEDIFKCGVSKSPILSDVLGLTFW